MRNLVGVATKTLTLFFAIAELLTFGAWAQESIGRSSIVTDEVVRRKAAIFSKPRLMTLDDLGDEDEKGDFLAYGYSFVVEGDFDGDGQKDYVVAGKYENQRDPTNSSFILILTGNKGDLRRTYLRPIPTSRISLKRIPNCRNGRDGVALQITISSDYGARLVWDGRRYVVVEHCDSKQ